VSDSLDAVRRRVERVLARETDLSPAERERVVETALSTWERPSVRALAVANGSVVPRVVAAADAEGAAATRLRIRLRVAVAEARESGSTRVPEETVDTAADAVRRVSETAASEALGTATDRAVDRLKQRADGRAAVVPAGLPLLPTPTNWYATVNVWEVRVRGAYPRFAVRTARGAPGETVTYVRDGGAATLDVDDDGNAERLGRAERIEFAVRTVVLVGVPPYRTGVGDVDGQAVETSPGWNASDAGASDVSGAVVAASGSKRPGRTAAGVGDRRE
jgi:hypothetical protein